MASTKAVPVVQSLRFVQIVQAVATSLYGGEIGDHNLGNFLIVIVGGHNAQPILHCSGGYPDVIGGYRRAGLPQPIKDECVSFSRFFGDIQKSNAWRREKSA